MKCQKSVLGKKSEKYPQLSAIFAQRIVIVCVCVLRFYGPVNPMETCRVRSVYLTIRLLGRLSPLSG